MAPPPPASRPARPRSSITSTGWSDPRRSHVCPRCCSIAASRLHSSALASSAILPPSLSPGAAPAGIGLPPARPVSTSPDRRAPSEVCAAKLASRENIPWNALLPRRQRRDHGQGSRRQSSADVTMLRSSGRAWRGVSVPDKDVGQAATIGERGRQRASRRTKRRRRAVGSAGPPSR